MKLRDIAFAVLAFVAFCGWGHALWMTSVHRQIAEESHKVARDAQAIAKAYAHEWSACEDRVYDLVVSLDGSEADLMACHMVVEEQEAELLACLHHVFMLPEPCQEPAP